MDIVIIIEDKKKDRIFKSRKKGKIIKPSINKNGYLRICLCKDKIKISKSVHRLVAKAFIPNPNNLPQVNHINGDKTDNRVENLEWCTAQENIKHSWKNGLSRVTEGMREHCKTYNKKIIQYDKNYNFIKEWASATEVERTLHISQQSIVACLKGRSKTAGGYIWRYKIQEQN